MRARLALIGGEEFAPGFEETHAGLLAEAPPGRGGGPRRVVYLPTCAADDGDEAIDYWCAAAREQLSASGAIVETPRVVDIAGANDERHAQLVAEADWVYLGGGYPHVAMRILPDTRVLAALQAALARGALLAGSSGGAMLMGERSLVMTPELAAEIGRVWEHGAPPDWDPPRPSLMDCLGLVPRGFCAPHFNRVFAWKWLEQGLIPAGFTLIGLDEQTALVSREDGMWEVRGRGVVTLIRDDLKPVRYGVGERLML